MSLFIASIASGSNGNCYYVGTATDAVLVDVGISCREVEARMKSLGLSPKNVKAIFISHEHGDHIRGVSVLARKWRIPVWSTPGARRRGGFWVDGELVRTFTSDAVTIEGLTVQPFRKAHDAADPYSFTIQANGVTVGVFTDIGTPCSALAKYFKTCHAAFLEANYDEEMLDRGNYPYHLKNRIRGGSGHLSNHQALNVFLQHRTPALSHLLLAHLSKNNNCPKLVATLFEQHKGATNVMVASRYEASPLLEVTALPKAVIYRGAAPQAPNAPQLALF